MPTPRRDETRDEFIARCIPIVLEDGTADDEDQAVAICVSMWEEREKEGAMTIEYKTVQFDVKDFDYEGRTVEGYASVFENVDLGNDIIHRGAFAKTLLERGDKVRFLWQHDMHEPLGRPVEMREDEYGLYIKAIISDTARGRDALALLRDKAISGLSIGYDAIPGGTDYENNGDRTVRHLREIRLWEFSLVSMPMNELANVTALKMLKERENEVKARFKGLVDQLREALAEAEALLENESDAPDEESGRDEDAPEQEAGPDEAPPTSEETEHNELDEVREALLAQIEQLEDSDEVHQD